MNGIAALAAKEAAVVGLGASLLPGVASSAVDGFAAGTLLSGMCFLLVIGPRRRQRKARLAKRDDDWPASDSRPAHAGYAAAPVRANLYAKPYANPYANPYAEESAETLLPAGLAVSRPVPLPAGQPAGPVHADERAVESASPGSPDYRSRHRLPGSEGEPRQEQRRAPGRHAAPPVRFSSRMASRLPFHALAVRD